MGVDQVVQLGRGTLEEVVLLALPILGISILVSLLVNIVQTLTSLQEMTISTVPRLLATAAAVFFLMPWMWRHLTSYTTQLLSDFHRYLN